MSRFWIRMSLCIFFSLVLFLLGAEAARLPVKDDQVAAHVIQTNDPFLSDKQAEESDTISSADEIKRIRNNQMETKNIFSQAGIWLETYVSNGFTQILEKIFS